MDIIYIGLSFPDSEPVDLTKCGSKPMPGGLTCTSWMKPVFWLYLGHGQSLREALCSITKPHKSLGKPSESHFWFRQKLGVHFWGLPEAFGDFLKLGLDMAPWASDHLLGASYGLCPWPQLSIGVPQGYQFQNPCGCWRPTIQIALCSKSCPCKDMEWSCMPIAVSG